MKKTAFIRIILSLFLALPLLNACRKGEVGNGNQSITKQVNTWLDQQKTAAASTTAAKIQALKGDLDFSRSRTEELRAGEKFVIVPTRGNYVVSNTLSAHETKTPPVNLLVLILDKTGKIRKGNIVQYRPQDPNAKDLPDNTFYKLFNDKILDCSGRFRYLNLNEKEQYEYKYTNGRMTAYSIAQSKQKDKIATISQDPFGPVCIDWYWVTIDNDTGEVISEDYLYTTCTGDGGGSGGGDSAPPADSAAKGVSTQKDWTVKEVVAYRVTSTERLEGVKDANEIAGGHFTAITHLGTSWSYPPGGDCEWKETGATESVNGNGSTGTSYVSGTVKFLGGDQSQIIIDTKYHTWIFSQLFP